ncbi:uncharacterized protein [Salminus brasiliensis]|uniref:uncharacterized protein n=1 Tax=Salminus brasiliensis TaxID=930266 RepID=UPI003B8317F2
MFPALSAKQRDTMRHAGRILRNFFALLVLSSVTVAVTVELGHSTTISCRQNCSTVEWWTNGVETYRIFRFAEGSCAIVGEFEGRIECSAEKINGGDVSLTIHSVVYNDRGWYYCSCDGKDQCDRRIEVIVPASLNISVGGTGKLSCYAETDKRTPDSSTYVLWEKDGQQVVKLEQGKMSYGSGFEQRVLVSDEDYRKGDLSLTISDVRFSDSGLYRCSLKDEEYGYPNSITLSVQAHRFEHHEKEGDSVLLDLVMSPPLMVFFTKAGEDTADSWICTRAKAAVHCKAGYDHRASIMNTSLKLGELTVADSGTYKITDIHSEIIAIHRLTVIGLPSAKIPVAALVPCGLVVVVLSTFALWACLRKSKQQKQRKQLGTEEEQDMTGPDVEHVQLSIQQSESIYRSPLPWAMKLINNLPTLEDHPEEEVSSPAQATEQDVQEAHI